MSRIVDYRFMTEPKLLKLRARPGGQRALCVYITSLLWAEKYDTDLIHKNGGVRIFDGTPNTTRLLVELGLWRKVDDGWQIVGLGLGQKRAIPDGNPVVYLIRDGDAGPVKVGSSRKPARRMAQLQTGHPRRLHLLGVAPGLTEREAHQTLAEYRLHGEWFALPEEVIAHMLEGVA